MAKKKTVFLAFAIEDQRIRDMLKGQSLSTYSPFEYIDMSVKKAYDIEWKKRVRARIKRSDGVLAIVSRSSLNSTGQKWEITCAKQESVPLRGIWAYPADKTSLLGVKTMTWSWRNIASWIDSL